MMGKGYDNQVAGAFDYDDVEWEPLQNQAPCSELCRYSRNLDERVYPCLEYVERGIERCQEVMTKPALCGFVPEGCFGGLQARRLQYSHLRLLDAAELLTDPADEFLAVHAGRCTGVQLLDATQDFLFPRATRVRINRAIQALHEVMREVCAVGRGEGQSLGSQTIFDGAGHCALDAATGPL
jgi:hypothetical protein